MKNKYILLIIIIIVIFYISIQSYGMYKYTFKIDAYNLTLNTEQVIQNYENNNNILNINKNDSEHSITNTNEKDSIIDLYVIKKYQ